MKQRIYTTYYFPHDVGTLSQSFDVNNDTFTADKEWLK